MSGEINLTNPDKLKHILQVISNPATSTTLGIPVGFWGSELTHAYHEFMEVGYKVTVASPNGGACRLDAWSDPRDPSKYMYPDLITMGFINTPELWSLVEHTAKLATLNYDDYDAIVVVGGEGPMFTFRENEDLKNAVRTFYEARKVTAALCHGVAALIDVKLSDGSYLIAGKTITGFANVEEEYANNYVGKQVMPWYIEDAAKERGANYIQGGRFSEKVSSHTTKVVYDGLAPDEWGERLPRRTSFKHNYSQGLQDRIAHEVRNERKSSKQ